MYKTHNLVRFVRDPKELGKSPVKLLYDRSLWQQMEGSQGNESDHEFTSNIMKHGIGTDNIRELR